jgi:hypothetical protein
MTYRLAFGRDARVNTLLGAGHFLSHFYQLCLPPLFIAWQQAFDVSFAELGLAMAVMAGAAAVMQTPMGFLVDRYGARPFLVGGTLLMTLSIAAMGFATAYWQIVGLASLSGVGNSVIHPADYAILSGSVDRAKLGRSFASTPLSAMSGLPPPRPQRRLSHCCWAGAARCCSSVFSAFRSSRRSCGRAASSPIRLGSRAAARRRPLPARGCC